MALEMDSTAKTIMVGMAGSVWLNTQLQYCGIDDSPTEKVYQINNGLDDTLHDRNRRIIQQAVLNWKCHQDGFNGRVG